MTALGMFPYGDDDDVLSHGMMMVGLSHGTGPESPRGPQAPPQHRLSTSPASPSPLKELCASECVAFCLEKHENNCNTEGENTCN